VRILDARPNSIANAHTQKPPNEAVPQLLHGARETQAVKAKLAGKVSKVSVFVCELENFNNLRRNWQLARLSARN
jgi:hypothetical protein